MLWGEAGPDFNDNQNRLYGDFQGAVRSTNSFLPHPRILILAEFIAGRRSAPKTFCSIVSAILNCVYLKNYSFKFKIYFTQFLSSRPETFRICSRAMLI